MIRQPKKGRRYWYVTDIWEVNIVVRVKVTSNRIKPYDMFRIKVWAVRYEGSPGYEEFGTAARHELFTAKKKAERKAARLNKKYKEARQRDDY